MLPLAEVARRSDAIVCCLPLTKATHGLLGRDFLAACKPDAILVNVSRGKVVDEDALFEHLRTHPQAAAALDVWWQYPKTEGERPYHRPFPELPNVVMTPHVAYAVPDNADGVLDQAVANVARYLRGERPENVVDAADYR